MNEADEQSKHEAQPQAILLLATMVVRRTALAEFRAFERNAQRIMARYGGVIREAVLIDPEPHAETVREVHVVAFPDSAAFAAYRADPELIALRPLRERAVVSTELEIGAPPPQFP